jgi:hypothetical protein
MLWRYLAGTDQGMPEVPGLVESNDPVPVRVVSEAIINVVNPDRVSGTG